jgi:uncharacterized membrane-anchored protein
MVVTALVSALLSLAVFFCTGRVPTIWRVLLALAVFLIGTIGLFAVGMYYLDRPPPCSRSVDPQTGKVGPLENCPSR